MGNFSKYEGERKSHQSLKEIYFWTSVIKDWKHLLKTDEMKMIISSAKFFETGEDEFNILTHLMDKL